MTGYGTTSMLEEGGLAKPSPEKLQRRITIACGKWSPDSLLRRLRDGGCPIRHCTWVHYDRAGTIQCVVEVTPTGLVAMMEWLHQTYVIPKELDIAVDLAS